MNIFEYASRNRLLFPSPVGALHADQLWDLPLTSRSESKPSLDAVARAVNAELKEQTEESFVSTTPNLLKEPLAVALEVVKYIIAVKQKAAEDNANRLARAEKRRKIIDALAAKEDAELSEKSREELIKELEEIDA